MTSLMPRLVHFRCLGKQIDLAFTSEEEYRTDLSVFFHNRDNITFARVFRGVPSGTSYGESTGAGGYGLYNRLLGEEHVIG